MQILVLKPRGTYCYHFYKRLALVLVRSVNKICGFYLYFSPTFVHNVCEDLRAAQHSNKALIRGNSADNCVIGELRKETDARSTAQNRRTIDRRMTTDCTRLLVTRNKWRSHSVANT